MSAEPTISAKTHREKAVSVRWENGAGPIVLAPYMDGKTVSLTYVLVKQQQGRDPFITSARGLYCKKDGSVGSRAASLYFNNMQHLPNSTRDAVLAALKGVAW